MQEVVSVEELEEMSNPELKSIFIDLHNEVPNSHNRGWLIRRISWRLQANQHGGHTDRFLSHARNNAHTLDIRTTPPKEPMKKVWTKAKTHRLKCRDPRIPEPGVILERLYKGRHIAVKVLENGFEWNDQFFTSFSAAVKTATGSNYGPYQFFKLGKAK